MPYSESLDEKISETPSDWGKEALAQPHVKPFDITGRPMKGWVMVEEEGFEGPALAQWLSKAREFAASLPPK